MLFPKIKKELRSFLLDESGGSSKNAVLRLGVYSVLAALAAVKVKADTGYNDDSCTLTADQCKISCNGMMGPLTRGIKLRGYVYDSSDDHCDAPFASDFDNVGDTQEVVGATFQGLKNAGFLTLTSGDDNAYAYGTIRFTDFSDHSNSLEMASDGQAITASHDHELGEMCPDTYLEFHASCHDNNHADCYCDIIEDGAKKPPQDGNTRAHTYHSNCYECG